MQEENRLSCDNPRHVENIRIGGVNDAEYCEGCLCLLPEYRIRNRKTVCYRCEKQRKNGSKQDVVSGIK